MDKDKPSNHGGSLLPPSGRYSLHSSHGTGYSVKSELSPSPSSALPPLSRNGVSDSGFNHGKSLDVKRFSHDISQMPDNPPKKLGHRRAHSEILTLPDDLSFDYDLGIVGGFEGPSMSDETDEDMLSMYLELDKFNSSSATSSGIQAGESSSAMVDWPSLPTPTSSAMVDWPSLSIPISSATATATAFNERPRIRHQHSQSMDGLSTINPEMLMSNTEESSAADAKKAMSATKLAELALVDPKRAKRIWANRQSAARSKERKMRYIGELERKVLTLQTEATSLSTQLTLLQRDTSGLTVENNELKLRLQAKEQQVHLQDALNDAIKEEIQHLKVVTGQAIQNVGPMTNFPLSFGSGQQFYGNSHAMHTHLTAQKFQQLQIQSQKLQQQQQQQQHHHHLNQIQHQQLQPQTRASSSSVPSPDQKESSLDAKSSSSVKE
ncbi:probable transcription factor PosF21 [Impatiens glandulifera]|uniref:probable transcription factor PosF21 n=1 Tax=Impatiens glandulifera TaxID=253017 RepID=UPI001FB0A218|nr:probable transcription factor PosF21 [Impatiens glandulifera]